MEQSQISDNNKRIAKNTIYMYIRMLVMLFVSLFTSRIILEVLGFDNFGIYNVVGSIIVFFSFLNNSLGLATRRYITAELSKGTAESQRRIFNLALLAHVYISLLILFFSETIGLYLVNEVLTIPSDRLLAANVVYQLSVISAIIGILQSPFGAALVAKENMSIYAYFSIFDVLFKLVIVFVLKYVPGDSLIIYAILMFLVSSLTASIYSIYCYRTYAFCHLKWYKNRTGLSNMFSYMGWSLFGQGAVVLTNQGVTMLLNIFSGLIANAAMGVSNTITNIVTQFVSNFQLAFNPQITKHYVAQEFDSLYNLTIRASRYSNYLVIIFLIPFIFQINNFLTLWLGKFPEYAAEFSVLTLICIYIDSLGAPLWMIIGSDENIKKYQVLVSCIFLFNFIGSFILLKLHFFPYVVIVVRIVVTLCLLLFRLYWCKRMMPSFPVRQWFEAVLENSLLIFPVPIVGSFLMSIVIIDNLYVNFLANVIVSVLLCLACIFIVGLNKKERKFILDKVKILIIKN